MRSIYFSPRTMQSHLKSIRENTYLAQFFCCRSGITLRELNLQPFLSQAFSNFMTAKQWGEQMVAQEVSELDKRIYGNLSANLSTKEFEEEILYFIDILICGGVKVEVPYPSCP